MFRVALTSNPALLKMFNLEFNSEPEEPGIPRVQLNSNNHTSLAVPAEVISFEKL